MKKNLLFGPVKSRRLGISLGVDIQPYKTCSYDCIYCERGKTTDYTIERRIFCPTGEILEQVESFIKNPDSPNIDVITFAGDGEPALSKNLGEVIRRIKDITPVPVAVITNSSLLWMEEVRDELASADIVLPSLDAVTEEFFEKIDRPHPGLSLKEILDGLFRFSRTFSGRLFPEVMIIEGMNDNDEEVDRLIEFLKKLNPDRVHLNIVDRYTTEDNIESPPTERLREIKARFPADIPVDIVGLDPDIFSVTHRNNIGEKILSYLARRAAVPGDIAAAMGIPPDVVYQALRDLEEQDKIIEIPDRTDNYYYINR